MGIKKILNIVAAVMTAAVLTGGGIYYKVTNDLRSFKKNFTTAQYTKALDQYKGLEKKYNAEKFKSFTAKVEFFFQDEFKNIEEKIKTGKMTSEQAIGALNSMEQYNLIKDKVQQERTWVLMLNDSKNAYKSGLENLDKKDYYTAAELFKNVVQYDTNYEDAQKKLKEITPLIRQQAMEKAEEFAKNKEYSRAQGTLENIVKYYMEDKEIKDKIQTYKTAYENQVKEKDSQKLAELKDKQLMKVISCRVETMANSSAFITVKNTSTKTIKSYKVAILMFDKDGKPLGSNNLMYCKTGDRDVNIKPNATSGTDYYWDLKEKVGNIKACISEVVFSDGSTWANEYVDYWYSQEKDKY